MVGGSDEESVKQKASADFVILVFSGEGEVQANEENLKETLGWEQDLKSHIEDIEGKSLTSLSLSLGRDSKDSETSH